MTDADNTVEACLSVWADTNAVVKYKSFPSELATVGDMKLFMERLVIEQVNKTFGYGLTTNEVSSKLCPDIDMDADLHTVGNLTIIIQPTPAARGRLQALPSMTKLQDDLNVEKKRVSVISETARLLNTKLKEQLLHDSVVNMELKLEARRKKELADVEALRKKDREEAEAQRKKDREDADRRAKEQRKRDSEKAKQNAEKAEALRKKEREDDKKWAEEQNRKLKKHIQELEDEIKHLKQHQSEREDHWKQKLESTQRYIDSCTSDINGFVATGDGPSLDHIKRRNLLDRAQALLAVSLGLSNTTFSASSKFREALGSSFVLEERRQLLLAMLEEKKDKLPSQAVVLMSKPEALDLLAERFPQIRSDGDNVAHGYRERTWYQDSISRSKDKVALRDLLDYISSPAQ